MSLIRTREGSVADNIVRLDVGQSFSMSRLIGPDNILPIDAAISQAKDKIASHFSRHLHTIRQAHPHRVHQIETGTMIGSRNNVYVVGVLTRLADEGEL